MSVQPESRHLHATAERARPPERRTVYVVGSINVDLSMSVERLPEPGSSAITDDVVRSCGGKAANVAVAAARDGAAVRLVGAVGDDSHGSSCLSSLRSEGVDATGTVVVGERPTGVAVVCVDDAGHTLTLVAAGANSGLAPKHVEAGLHRFRRHDVCVMSFGVSDDSLAVASAALARRGGHLVVNPSPLRDIAEDVLVPGSTLVLNAAELRQIAGADFPAGALALRRRSQGAVVVTRGAQGAGLLTVEGEQVDLPVHQVKAVDTTGAGDTFIGVLAAALACGSDIVDAARRGAAAASLSVTGFGAQAAMPRSEAIDRLLPAR